MKKTSRLKINMIPKEEYLECEQFSYVTEELIYLYHTTEEVEKFFEWISNQTCGVVNGKIAIYSWDYERWIEQGKKTSQNFEDWD